MSIARPVVVADHLHPGLPEQLDGWRDDRGADAADNPAVRYDVMLDMMGDDWGPQTVLLDFACGTGDLLRHVQSKPSPGPRYVGADISEPALALARQMAPGAKFVQIDILSASEQELAALRADYCVVDGLFTAKGKMTDEAMWQYVQTVVTRLWSVVGKGIAFNVMSKQVEHERSELFHLSFDKAAEFLRRLAGGNVAFRADYGQDEYTCFAFRKPLLPDPMAKSTPASGIVPVCRPILPKFAATKRYMARIDDARWYTNWGPLNAELETRLASHLGMANGTCITANNCTDAITAALIAIAGRAGVDRPLCLMPSYSYVATAAAALGAGYQPYFLDVDGDTMALDPASVVGLEVLSRTGAIVTVAPYGRPVDVAAWEQLARRTSIPVVIDAAAGFDAVATGSIRPSVIVPIALSFHATKAFGVGEGGALLVDDSALAQECRRALNFGFLGDRRAQSTGINGKLSEYHAAVGLAELDGWAAKRLGFIAAARGYEEGAAAFGFADRLMVSTHHASSYALFRAANAADARALAATLTQHAVETRWWYGNGIHDAPAYQAYPHAELPQTLAMAPAVLGLPMSADITASEVHTVLAAIAYHLKSAK